ncbi:MAG: 30S ribosomal protein S16 [Ignavibacteriae bacterium]|nr:30S ribosomal protein S16 [Ignavibacteriota bacterium]
MVTLRLRRVGKKKQPIYKIVVADSRASRNGKFIETLGQYNPLRDPIVIEVNESRLFSWLKRGAQPSDTLRSLLRRKGLWLKWTLLKKRVDEATIATELEKWQMLQAEKLGREADKKQRRHAGRKKKSVAEETAATTSTTSPPEPAASPAE